MNNYEDFEFKDLNFYNYTKQENSPCDTCSNNPKNGGSGICHCILGLRDTYC